MNNGFIEARELVAKARELLRRGDKAAARQLGERAAFLAPEMEDVWLILTASDPDPHEALAYAQKALEITPQSARARRAVEWASGRLTPPQASVEPKQPKVVPSPVDALTSLPSKHAYQTAVTMPALKSQGRNWLLPALLSGLTCVLLGFAVLFALTSPALASIVSSVRAPAPTPEILWAPAEIVKPAAAPIGVSAFAQAADTATPVPTDIPPTSVPTEEPTASQAPTDVPTEAPAVAPAVTETPGSMVLEVVPDTPTSEYVAPTNSAPSDQYASSGNGERWIDVDLSNQRVYAYEGDVIVNSFIVSTGTWLTPTVTGKYNIYVKIRSGSMHGPGYFLPDVPYIMYFYKGYGLHGTYWHNNFGTPMSHGCVNLRTDDAAWLFNWASVGTLVNVHY